MVKRETVVEVSANEFDKTVWMVGEIALDELKELREYERVTVVVKVVRVEDPVDSGI